MKRIFSEFFPHYFLYFENIANCNFFRKRLEIRFDNRSDTNPAYERYLKRDVIQIPISFHDSALEQPTILNQRSDRT